MAKANRKALAVKGPEAAPNFPLTDAQDSLSLAAEYLGYVDAFIGEFIGNGGQGYEDDMRWIYIDAVALP